MIIGVILVVALILGNLIGPLQSVFANISDGSKTVTRGGYFDLPETIDNYVSSGKTLEFDLNIQIETNDVLKFALCYDKTRQGIVSTAFNLCQEVNGPDISVEPIEDGWYHYTVSLATLAPAGSGNVRQVLYLLVTALNIQSNPTKEIKINNISIGEDVRALPEAFTEDYDTVTLADLGLAGTDYKTPISSGTYNYNGKSKTHSVIVKFGWEAKISSDIDWKIALDTYWNANCMVWFRDNAIYFCPGQGTYNELHVRIDEPVLSGKHNVEFGRLRVTAGPNYGMDYVFLKIDGEVKAAKYTKHYQTPGGYDAYDGNKFLPSYTVHFVNDGVVKQGFSGFAKPDEYVTDIDYINIGDIVPGGVVKDTIHDNFLGYNYPVTTSSSTNSTVVKYVIKTGKLKEGALDGSVMVVDIGGNCGFCRAYIPSGEKNQIMFGWEIEGCTSGTKKYTFESNTWYAVEQGRVRVASGINKGKDYVYLKIDGSIVSSFYANPASRPMGGKQIYIEATQEIQIVGYNELRAKYYVGDELYLDQLAQKGFTAKQPADPEKSGNYFVGWYTAKTGGKLFDFKNTKLTGNINLYARFTTETVKATFKNANGGVISAVTVGKNCLITPPTAPSYSGGKYEYTFVGWKNDSTGKIFNFETDRISVNTTFTAQYKEKEYFVSYYANGKLVKKVPFVLSNPTVNGKEPAVPKIANATGKWEEHSVSGLTKSMTVNAVYTVKVPSASSAVKLTEQTKIYLNTDMIHDYLSTETAKQTAFVREYYSAAQRSYQDYQNTSFKWTDSGKNSSYTVYFADNKDFKNAYIVTTSKTSLINEVGIFVPGKTYYWFVCGNNTGKCSAVDSFTVVNTPVRYITAGSVINMRDLGGQVNADGDKVKYELIYRGAALDEFTSHLDDDARYVFEYLGMKSEIELRGGMDHDYTPWDENNSAVYYARGAGYQEIFTMGSDQITQYKAMFEALADESNYPFYFHCSAGADRTGTLAFLLYGLLGVSYDDIRPEYELTTFSAIGLRAADLYSGELSMDETHRRMLEQYGDGSGNLQVAVQNYLTNYVGISNVTLESIKGILLDKNAIPNEEPNIITVDVLGKKYTYQSFDGVYFMPEAPKAMGKLFVGFYNGSKKYNGYTNSDLSLTAKFEDIKFEPYDTISLKDLGVKEDKILNQTNTVLTYEKTAKSGGRLLQFILEPVGNMNNGDGPQVALTNNWEVNSFARAWFQTNTMSHIYYNGALGSGPDISKMLSLEAGKQYNIEFAVRVMKNKGYEGKKIFEVTVNGELLIQYIGCKADLSENMIYFHGGTGSAYLINNPVYKTVKFYNGNTLLGTYKVERSGLLPKVKEPAPKNGLPFAGWYTAKTGGELWDENADLVYNDMSLYAHFANVKVITANVDGKTLTYRVEVGNTLEELPKPQKPGNVFMGWAVNGKLFTGKVTSNMNISASFEAYSFDDYDEISLRDLGINNDFDVSKVSATNTANYTYRKAAKTGGRVFKAIFIPTENMMNGPQISFSPKWDENYFAKLYFTKFDMLYVYSSGIDGGLPTLTLNTDIIGGKEYLFEIGVRVLNNKGYKGVKVLTVYLNGELIFEEFDNRANIEGSDVFFQGMPNTGILRNIDIYKTVSFYDGDKLLSSLKVLRGNTVKSYGKLADKGDRLFMGWFTELGEEWDFDIDCIYLDTVFKAKFQKRTYPVLLMVDGVLYKRLNIFAGECADILDIPTKEGFEFEKWLCEDGSEYDMQTPVKAPITLNASFKMSAVADSTPQSGDAKPIEPPKNKSSNLKYILFSIIGLAVIAIETGVIIFKKRSKR